MRVFLDPILKKLRQKDASSSGSSEAINPDVDELDPVISYTNTPPGAPATGDRYLINTAPTGAWVGKATQIAEWDGAAWVYTVPVLDDYIFVTDTLLTYRFSGTAWAVSTGVAILQNGNRFGATGARIGTNDNAPIYWKTNGVLRGTVGAAGNFGFGITTAPSARVHIVSTTEQLRVGYNTTNYFKAVVDSTGLSTFSAVGSGALFQFNNKIGITSTTEQLRVGYDASNYYTTTVGSTGITTFDASGSGATFEFLKQVWYNGAGNVITNTSFGEESLRINTTGASVTGFGYATLFNNIIGNDCTAFGAYALLSSNSDANTGIGSSALRFTSSGIENTALGSSAAYSNTTGNYNCAFGNVAIRSNTTGSFNMGFGYGAIFTNSVSDGNVGIGAYAGYLTTGAKSIFIGHEAGRYETAGNSLYIHNGLGVGDLATGKTNSLIYGVFDASTANQRLRINGNIGIRGAATSTSPLNISSLPTSSAGLVAGDIWSNLGILTIV